MSLLVKEVPVEDETRRVWALVTTMIEQQEQLLICQRGPTINKAGFWGFAGGHPNVGEDAYAAVERETLEETQTELVHYTNGGTIVKLTGPLRDGACHIYVRYNLPTHRQLTFQHDLEFTEETVAYRWVTKRFLRHAYACRHDIEPMIKVHKSIKFWIEEGCPL